MAKTSGKIDRKDGADLLKIERLRDQVAGINADISEIYKEVRERHGKGDDGRRAVAGMREAIKRRAAGADRVEQLDQDADYFLAAAEMAAKPSRARTRARGDQADNPPAEQKTEAAVAFKGPGEPQAASSGGQAEGAISTATVADGVLDGEVAPDALASSGGEHRVDGPDGSHCPADEREGLDDPPSSVLSEANSGSVAGEALSDGVEVSPVAEPRPPRVPLDMQADSTSLDIPAFLNRKLSAAERDQALGDLLGRAAE